MSQPTETTPPAITYAEAVHIIQTVQIFDHCGNLQEALEVYANADEDDKLDIQDRLNHHEIDLEGFDQVEENFTLPYWTETTDSTEAICNAARYNSGEALCDSGDIYGRHHGKPPVKQDEPICKFDVCEIGDDEIYATIETPLFLAEFFEHLQDVQCSFNQWTETREYFDHFENGEDFMKLFQYNQVARDNVYNMENNLSQAYIYEVYVPEWDDSDDWLCSDNALVLIYMHTGCDVRGGYAPAVILKANSNSEISLPIDLVAEIHLIELHDENGDELETDEHGEEWQCGYSNNPVHEFNKELEKVLEIHDDGALTVKLTTGQIAKIEATARTY